MAAGSTKLKKFTIDNKPYWISRTPKLGMIVYDRSMQGSVNDDEVCLYIVQRKEFATFKKEILKANLSPEGNLDEGTYREAIQGYIAKYVSQSRRNNEYIGTTVSGNRIYHMNRCPYMKNVSFENEIAFKSKEAAMKWGYRPCKVCRP